MTSKCASRHNSVHFLNISTFLSLIDSFSSLTLPASAFPSVHIVGSFLLKIVPECGQLLKTMLPGIPRNSQVENARKLMKMVETLGVPTTQGLSLSHHALRFTDGHCTSSEFLKSVKSLARASGASCLQDLGNRDMQAMSFLRKWPAQHGLGTSRQSRRGAFGAALTSPSAKPWASVKRKRKTSADRTPRLKA